MKQCTICKISKELNAFNKHKRQPDGLQPHCRTCNSLRSKAYYQKNKEKHKLVIKQRQQAQRNICREWVYQYLLQHPCTDCGEKDPLVLQFDHVRGVKRDNISSMLKSNPCLKTIKQEVIKCEVRCANCHSRKTARDFNWWTFQKSMTDGSSDGEQPAFNRKCEESSPSHPTNNSIPTRPTN